MAASGKLNPTERIKKFISLERTDIWSVLVYSILIGILSLIVPIAIQALVNIVAFGSLLQPLIVLSVFVFIALGFSGALRAFQTLTIEILQRRIFVRTSFNFQNSFLYGNLDDISSVKGWEKANYFFEVFTLQKVAVALLLDGISIVIQAIVGMIVAAVYHSVFIMFDILILTSLFFVIMKVLGKGASHSSIEESKSKHETIFHLEEIVRNPEFYRSDSGFRFSEYRMTHLLENYLANRKLHFRIMFRQHLGLILLQILGSTFLLGVGGYLVLQKELSLGQLIAAELIFSRILDSLGKSGKYFENYYDLVAAIDKIGIVEDRISVSRESNQFHQFEKYKTISVQNLVLPGSMQSGKFNFSIPENRKILIEDESSSGTSLLFDCLTGLKQPESGRISIGNYNLNELNTEEIGKIFYLIRGNQILKVSLLDNLRGGNQEISSDGIRSILKRMDLLGLISRFENGLDEILYPLVSVNDEESNLIGIIRGYFSDSKVLLLDGTLDYLSMSGKAKIQKLISGKGFSKSILVSSRNGISLPKEFQRIGFSNPKIGRFRQ